MLLTREDDEYDGGVALEAVVRVLEVQLTPHSREASDEPTSDS